MSAVDDSPVDEEQEQRVTALELFFDLVFVLAITQVTSMMSADPTWEGLARGLLVLGALWWAWVGYAWLTNAVDPDEGGARLIVFGAMAALLVCGLAVPEAFDEHATVFAVAYVVVRSLHVALYERSSRGDAAMHASVLALTPVWLLAPAMLIGASFLDGTAQGAVWVAALAIDYAAPYFLGVEGWRVSPAHFAERHGLIVIIALGESIVAIGVGASGRLGAGEIAAAVLGVVVVASLWWGYFDVVARVAERKLTETGGADRNRRARDTYSYLHLPMVAGIVLIALGLKKTLAHVDEPLEDVTAAALCGGVALYYLAHIGMRYRNVGSLNRPRLLTVVASLALIPIATEMDALVLAGLVAAILVTLVSYETLRWAERRHEIRAGSI